MTPTILAESWEKYNVAAGVFFLDAGGIVVFIAGAGVFFLGVMGSLSSLLGSFSSPLSVDKGGI